MKRALVGGVAVLVAFSAACESDRLQAAPSMAPRDGGARADATSGGDDGAAAATKDAWTPESTDAGAEVFDARAADGGGPSSPDASALDAGALDAGAPDGALGSILVADPIANRIYLLDTRGARLRDYPSPIPGVRAVAYDRRLRDGFWVAGAGGTNPLFTKVDWSGAVVRTQDYAHDRMFQFREDGVKAIDYALGTSAAGDGITFLFTNYNDVDVVGIGPLAQVGWAGETSFGLHLGFFGVHTVSFSLTNANALELWTTKDGALESWVWAGSTARQSLPTGAAALGGVALAADGTAWVSDPARNVLLHVDATGAPIGAPIAVMGRGVADLSLVE